MSKTIVKKVATKKVVKKEEAKEYHIVIKLNDNVFEFDTDDLRETILSVKPEFLRTRVLLEITKGGKTLDRMYYLQQGKMLFINKYAMDTLLKNLIF